MQSAVSVPGAMLLEVVTVAARHRTSVEAVVGEALRTYLEDLECGLLAPPPPEPAYTTRLRARRR